MQTTVTLWFWVGLAGMTAGTLLAASRFVIDPETRDLTAVLIGTTGIAAVAYLVMALGFGNISIAGTEIEIVRYADWLLTTPLMLLYLGLLARADRRILAALVGVDIIVVLGGIGATATGGAVGYALFGVGTVAYLVLAWLLARTLPRRASFDNVRIKGSFTTLRNLTVVVWSLYPVVWVLSTTGVGLLLPNTEALVLTYLDIVSKVGFVAIAVRAIAVVDDSGAETKLQVAD